MSPTEAPRRSLSIVVPCRNEAGHILAFLESLESQELDGFDWEAIIADGLSDDGTRQILGDYAAKNPSVRVIDNPGRAVSSGLNEAIRLSRGAVILRMDVHSTYAADYARRCVEALDETHAANVGGAARPIAEGLIPEAIAAAYQSSFGCGGARFHQSDFEGYVDTVTYGCWRREVFENVGLFDENLPRNQDDELNLRIVRSGGKIWQSAKIVSWYRPRATLGKLFRQYFQYGFWKVAVIRKHRLPGSWRHLVPAMFVAGLGLASLGLAAGWLLGWPTLTAISGTALMLALLLYGAACVAATVASARAFGWKLLPVLPLVFFTYHFSYGTGFLIGMVRHRRNASGGLDEALFSGVTR